MQAVLGLSITSGSVGWVVLDGSGVGPTPLDHDVFDVAGGSADGVDICRHIGAVRSAQAIAAASGQEMKSIGVTWTDGAAATADLVLDALPGLGFDKVVPVHLADVDEDIELTLARGAALAVRSGVETVAVPLSGQQPVARTRKQWWSGSSGRAAAVLSGGILALFVAGPVLAGQPEPRPASESSSNSVSVYAVPVAPSAVPPIAGAIQLVVGRPEQAPSRSSAPIVAESTADPEDSVQQARVLPEGTPAAPLPTTEPAPLSAPPVDPAQVVFSPLLSALP